MNGRSLDDQRWSARAGDSGALSPAISLASASRIHLFLLEEESIVVSVFDQEPGVDLATLGSSILMNLDSVCRVGLTRDLSQYLVPG